MKYIVCIIFQKSFEFYIFSKVSEMYFNFLVFGSRLYSILLINQAERISAYIDVFSE